jgi:hypothetical protein
VVVNVHSKIQLLEGLGGGLPKIEEPMFAGKPIGLQQNFVLAVMDYVAREMLGFGMLAYVLVHGSPTVIVRFNLIVRSAATANLSEISA